MAVLEVAEGEQCSGIVDGVTSRADVVGITGDAGKDAESLERGCIGYRAQLRVDRVDIVLR